MLKIILIAPLFFVLVFAASELITRETRVVRWPNENIETRILVQSSDSVTNQIFEKYYPNGVLFSRSISDLIRNRAVRTNYFLSGRTSFFYLTTNYPNGLVLENGTFFDEDGNLLFKDLWSNDLPIRLEIVKGNLINSVLTYKYKNGNDRFKFEFSKSGKIISSLYVFETGFTNSFKVFKDNEVLRNKVFYANGSLLSDFGTNTKMYYYPNGNLRRKNWYSNNLLSYQESFFENTKDFFESHIWFSNGVPTNGYCQLPTNTQIFRMIYSNGRYLGFE